MPGKFLSRALIAVAVLAAPLGAAAYADHGRKVVGRSGVTVSFKGHGHFRHGHGFKRHGFKRHGFHRRGFHRRGFVRKGFVHKPFVHRPFIHGGFRGGRHFGGSQIIVNTPIRPVYGARHHGGAFGRPQVVRRGGAGVEFQEGLLGRVIAVTPTFTIASDGRSRPAGYDYQIQFPDGRTAIVKRGATETPIEIGDRARVIETPQGVILRAE